MQKTARIPQTPRRIRDIQPKRLLQRLNVSKQNKHGDDDEWWYSANNNSNVGRAADVDSDSDSDSEYTSATHENFPSRRLRAWILLKSTYESIRQTPPQKRKKRLFWGLILITAWRTIYLADLDQYSSLDDKSAVQPAAPAVFNSAVGTADISPLKVVDDDWGGVGSFGQIQPIQQQSRSMVADPYTTSLQQRQSSDNMQWHLPPPSNSQLGGQQQPQEYSQQQGGGGGGLRGETPSSIQSTPKPLHHIFISLFKKIIAFIKSLWRKGSASNSQEVLLDKRKDALFRMMDAEEDEGFDAFLPI